MRVAGFQKDTPGCMFCGLIIEEQLSCIPAVARMGKKMKAELRLQGAEFREKVWKNSSKALSNVCGSDGSIPELEDYKQTEAFANIVAGACRHGLTNLRQHPQFDELIEKAKEQAQAAKAANVGEQGQPC